MGKVLQELQELLVLLVAASWIYWLVACWMTRCFFRTTAALDTAAASADGPLGDGRRTPFTPPVSILKPVRGLDPRAYENFAALCRQEYPEYEILFGVDDPDDPAVHVIRQLERDFPDVPVRLVVARAFGANRKASLLHYLAAHARYDVLVMSDSDMRAGADYLGQVVAPLEDEGVGLVTCPYVGDQARSFPAGLEALHMGVTFLPSVVVARQVLTMRFAMGASIAIRRRELERIGGFAVLADYLAEDYQLGARVFDLGLRVHLSDYVLKCILGATTFVEEWRREVRWARCARVSRPREYPGLLLSFSTPLAAVLVLLTEFSSSAVQALAVSLVLRWTVGWLVSGYTGDTESRRWLLWLPVRDVLSALVWLAAGLGRHVIWRGEAYELERDGRMHPVPADGPGLDDALGLGHGLDDDLGHEHVLDLDNEPGQGYGLDRESREGLPRVP